MSVKALDKSLASLQITSNQLIQGRVTLREKVATQAEELAKAAEDYFASVCSQGSSGKLKQALREKTIQYPILYQLTEILGHPALKFEYGLQRNLAKAARVLLEVFVIQLSSQEAGIDSDEVKRLQAIYKKANHLLPAKEVMTRFDLRCCKAAAKSLEFESGVYQQLAKKHATAVASGLVMTLLSTSPAPPYVSIAPIVPATVNLICDIYKHRPKFWYRDILALKLCAPEKCLVTVKQFKEMTPQFRKFFPNNTLASYLCQVFKSVMENDNAEGRLKNRVFQGKEISLIHFATFKPTGTDRYWETRYQAIVALSAFIEHQDYGHVSQQTIVKQMTTKKEHPHVKAIAREIVASNADKQYQIWKSTFQTVRQEAQQAVSRAAPLETIQQELATIQASIAELSNKLILAQTERQQHSATNKKSIEEMQQEFLLLQKLEQERKDYEEWLLEQNYVLETLQLFETS